MSQSVRMMLGLISAIAALAISSAAFSAESAYSPPIGSVRVTLAGAANSVPKISTFSPAMRLILAGNFVGRGRGTLTGVTSTTLTDGTAGWSAGALSQAATPYFVRIRSGSAEGTWWQVSTSAANTATTVTVLNRGINPVAAGVAAGDAYELVPADTLQTLFAGVVDSIGGSSAAVADLVRLHDGANWREYHYSTALGHWREGTSSFNRNNVIVRPDSGVVFIRRGAQALSLQMIGAVSDAKERVLIAGTGVTPVGSVFPVTRTLGSLSLQTAGNFVPFTGNLAQADKLNIFDGANWRSFHYNQSAAQWREGTSSFNRNTYTIPFGATLIVERGSAASGASFLLFLPPYTL